MDALEAMLCIIAMTLAPLFIAHFILERIYRRRAQREAQNAGARRSAQNLRCGLAELHQEREGVLCTGGGIGLPLDCCKFIANGIAIGANATTDPLRVCEVDGWLVYYAAGVPDANDQTGEPS